MAGFFCFLPFAASLLAACEPPPKASAGYVEGEYVLVAPIENARIEEVLVARGARITKGDILAKLDARDARLNLTQNAERLAEAKANLTNLRLGKRREEIAVVAATLTSAQATFQEATRELDRKQELRKRGVSSAADMDRATAARDSASAKVKELEAQMDVSRLAARPDEIAASERRVAQAQAAMEESEWRLSERVLRAPASGRVDEVIRRVGEMGGPAAPIVSLLPDGARKLRFYVAEKYLSSVQAGAEVGVSCDGCPKGLSARITYIAREAEFTPPVIYSVETRQKLVHLIEAAPLGDTIRLEPGQIVDIRLSAAGSTR